MATILPPANSQTGTGTVHISFKPGTVDRGKLYVMLRNRVGFKIIGIYHNFVFAVFECYQNAVDCLLWCRMTLGQAQCELAKHSYSIPYPQPVEDVSSSGWVNIIHLTHLPPHYSQAEIISLCDWLEGFEEMEFHGKYCYAIFKSSRNAAHARAILRKETNVVVTFSRAFRIAEPPSEPSGVSGAAAEQVPEVPSSHNTLELGIGVADTPINSGMHHVQPLLNLPLKCRAPGGERKQKLFATMSWQAGKLFGGLPQLSKSSNVGATPNVSFPFKASNVSDVQSTVTLPSEIPLNDLQCAHEDGDEALCDLLYSFGPVTARDVAFRLHIYQSPVEPTLNSIYTHNIASKGRGTKVFGARQTFAYVPKELIEKHAVAMQMALRF